MMGYWNTVRWLSKDCSGEVDYLFLGFLVIMTPLMAPLFYVGVIAAVILGIEEKEADEQ